MKLLANGPAKLDGTEAPGNRPVMYGIDLDEALITQLGPITLEQAEGLLEQFNPDLKEVVDERIAAATAKGGNSADRIMALGGIDVSSVFIDDDAGRAMVALEMYVNTLASPDFNVPYVAGGYAVIDGETSQLEPLFGLFNVDSLRVMPVCMPNGEVREELCVCGYLMGSKLDGQYPVYYPIERITSLVSLRTAFYDGRLDV